MGRDCCRQDKQQQQEVGKELIAQCKWLEENIDSNGPFFMGEQFSLVASRPRSSCAAEKLLRSAVSHVKLCYPTHVLMAK